MYVDRCITFNSESNKSGFSLNLLHTSGGLSVALVHLAGLS